MVFEKYRKKRQLEIARLESDILQLEYAKNVIKNASEQNNRLIQEDPDAHLWIQTGGVGGGVSGPLGTDLYDHYEMLRQAYTFYAKDLFGRAIVRNLSKFVLGRGPTIKPDSENAIVKDSWKRFAKANFWGLKEKEFVRRVFRDGEIFIRFFNGKRGEPLKIRFIRADNIRNPTEDSRKSSNENVSYGIGTDLNDIETPISYYYCDMSGNLIEKIPAAEILHIKILVDSDVKRGMSFLLVAMNMIKKYSDWLDDRISLNKVRSAIALIKKIEGNASTVQSIRDTQATEHKDSERNRQKNLRGGTVLTASKGISYEMLSPKINAPDVKDDGRAMLLAVAAGCGMPEMMLTSDYSNANYGSTMVAQNPFVREIEDWQDFFQVYYQLIFQRVIQHDKKIGDKKIPEIESEDCTVEFPPLILADILKNNQAREIQRRNKIISNKTWMMKEGLNPEEEERQMEDEMTKDIYATPFSMPVSPTNQFGSTSKEDVEE